MKNIMLLVISSFYLVGCVKNIGNGEIVSPDELSGYEIGELYSVLEIRPDKLKYYKVNNLGKIKGLSCNSGFYTNKSKEASIEQIKIKTVRLGGDAYTTPYCVNNDSVDWEHNCTSSIVCYSQALKILKKPEWRYPEVNDKNEVIM